MLIRYAMIAAASVLVVSFSVWLFVVIVPAWRYEVPAWGYAVTVIISASYLLSPWSFRVELRSLLKAAIAMQILGDLAFSGILQELPVFRFVKSLTTNDKFVSLVLLMGCIIAMDIGAAISGPWRIKQRLPGPPLLFDVKRSRAVGCTLISMALALKLAALAASGVLTSGSIITGILTWQPEDLVGLAFLDTGSSLAFPLGCALISMSRVKPAHVRSVFAIISFGVVSPWKGSALIMLLLYGMVISHFGVKEIKAVLWSKWTAVIIVILAALLSIKAQYRYLGDANTDAGSLLLGLVGGSSVRFMGGNFQTYAYTYKSVEAGAPLMDGAYNSQALYVWVPRQLWPSKPRFAGEEIYNYLDFNSPFDESYGTSSFSLTVFGSFFIDFGKTAAVVCSFVLGLALGLAQRLILWLRERTGNYAGIKYVSLSAIWMSCVFALSEAGLPGMIPALISGVAITYGVITTAAFLLWIIPRNPLGKWPKTLGTRSPS